MRGKLRADDVANQASSLGVGALPVGNRRSEDSRGLGESETRLPQLPICPLLPLHRTVRQANNMHDTVLAAAHYQQQQTLSVGVWDMLREEDIFWSRLKGSTLCTCKHTHTHKFRQMLTFFPAVILFAMWLSLHEREMQTCEWWIHTQTSAWEHTQSLAGKPPTQAHTYSESAYGNTHTHARTHARAHTHTHTHTHTHLSTEDRKQPTQLVFTFKKEKKQNLWLVPSSSPGNYSFRGQFRCGNIGSPLSHTAFQLLKHWFMGPLFANGMNNSCRKTSIQWLSIREMTERSRWTKRVGVWRLQAQQFTLIFAGCYEDVQS